MVGPGGDGAAVTVRLVLLRHGESTWNRTRRVQGQDDSSVLTAEGRDQVRRALESLREPVAAIVSSDLTRARESARIAEEILGLEVTVDPGLRERCFGALEGGSLDDVTAALVGIERGVVVDPDARPAGGESLREFAERSYVAVTRVARSGVPTLVVTHGGLVRAVTARLAGEPLLGLTWGGVANASLWPLDVERP